MPYDRISGLPSQVKKSLPRGAQEIYMAAFNSAWERLSDDFSGDELEARCHRIAWAAVKRKYEQNDDGNWVEKAARASTQTFRNVEIARTGTFEAVTGKLTLTTGDFDEAERAYKELKTNHHAIIKLGHDEDQRLLQEDGYPNAGFVENIHRSGDRLLADLVGVPSTIAELIKSGRYRARSLEAMRNLEVDGKKWPFVITGLALLGAELPAVDSLKDVQAVYAEKDIDFPEGAIIVMMTVGQPIKAKAVPSHKPPVAEDQSWDADRAVAEIRWWASSDDSGEKDKVDWDKYKWGFAVVEGDREDFTSYGFPHHIVRDGELRTSRAGVIAAWTAAQGARSGEANTEAQTHLKAHRQQLGLDEEEAAKAGKEDPEALIGEMQKLLSRIEALIYRQGGAPKFRALVKAATDELRSITKKSTKKEALEMELAELIKVLGMEENSTEEVVKTKLEELVKRPEEDKLASLKNDLAEAQKRIVALESERATDKATASVDAAIKARKFTPASRDTLIKMATGSPTEFSDLVKATPDNAVLGTGEIGKDGEDKDAGDLEPTELELSIGNQVNMSREELIEQKAIALGKDVPDDVAKVLAERRQK